MTARQLHSVDNRLANCYASKAATDTRAWVRDLVIPDAARDEAERKDIVPARDQIQPIRGVRFTLPSNPAQRDDHYRDPVPSRPRGPHPPVPKPGPSNPWPPAPYPRPGMPIGTPTNPFPGPAPTGGRWPFFPRSMSLGLAAAVDDRGDATRGYYVLYVDPSTPGLLAELQKLDAEVAVFDALPIVVTERRSVIGDAIAIKGVVGAGFLPLGLVTLIAGIDYLLGIAVRADLPGSRHDGDWVIGGQQADDPPGYPILENFEGHPRINVDRTRPWITPPAAMVAMNLSLGPIDPNLAFQPNDPINFATYWASQFLLVVMAAGNTPQGSDGAETMSAWAEAPWVLAVGATADSEGSQRADYSSVGTPGAADSGPDLVAWGASRLQETKVGTSFAAPRVAGMSLALHVMTSELRQAMARINDAAQSGGIRLAGVGIIDSPLTGGPRSDGLSLPGLPAFGVDMDALAISLRKLAALNIGLDVRPTAERLRDMLINSARSMPGYAGHQVGAGCVSDESIDQFIESFSGAHLAWYFSSRPGSEELRELSAVRLFEPGVGSRLRELTSRSAPIWHFDHVTNEGSLSWGSAA